MTKQYINLTENEREFIFIGIQNKMKKCEIAKSLGRNPSTITREIERNSKYIKKGGRGGVKFYSPEFAQKQYKERKSKAGEHGNVLKSYEIRMKVIHYLYLHYSPGLISGILKNREGLTISAETIYTFIYSKDYKHLKLREQLPRHRAKRKHKGSRRCKKMKIPNRVGIEERPETINTREEFGHRESDSIEGLRGTGCSLHVSVERKTRQVRIRKIFKKRGEETAEAMIDIWQRLPKMSVKSTTPDNGSEFAKREKVAKELGMLFYFARPYKSSDKGTVERINGFIRMFFPKGTDFTYVNEEKIKRVEDWINNRPMVVLGYKTPNEAFIENLKNIS